MTKIGYRFINWALIFLAGFITYELCRDVNGMEGTVVSEQHKGKFWKKDCQTIDLDDSFIYVQIEKNDNVKIGDRVRVKSNDMIIELSHIIQGFFLWCLILTCVVIAIVRTAIAADGNCDYRYLKD